MKVGVLNCSEIAFRRIIPAIQSTKSLSIQVVCSRDINKARLFAEKFNIPLYVDNQEDVNEVDIVYISSPPALHFNEVKKILNRGIHVLCEKPLTLSKKETDILINLAAQKNLLIQENYGFQYHPQWLYIKKNLPKIGNILYIKSSFEFPPRNELTDFRYKKELGGGSLLDAGGYPIKIASFLLKDLKFCNSLLNFSKKHKIDINGNCYLVDENGVSAFLSWGFNSTYKCNIEIVGETGTIKSNKIFSPKANEIVNVLIENLKGEIIENAFQGDHFTKIFDDFSLKIRNNDSSHFHEILKQAEWQNVVLEKKIKF